MKQGLSGGESVQSAHVFRGHTNVIRSRVARSSGGMHTFITSDSVFELMLVMYQCCRLRCIGAPTQDDERGRRKSTCQQFSLSDGVHVQHGDWDDGPATADASHHQHTHGLAVHQMAGRPRQQLSVRVAA